MYTSSMFCSVLKVYLTLVRVMSWSNDTPGHYNQSIPMSTSGTDWTFNNLHSMPVGSADGSVAFMLEH